MFKIKINKELCIGCGLCTKVCPYVCFELVEHSEEWKADKEGSRDLICPMGEDGECYTWGPMHSIPNEHANESCVGCRSCQLRCVTFAIDILEESSVAAG
ncbi:4Fe-4S binding protein [Spirochaetota bacterium]